MKIFNIEDGKKVLYVQINDIMTLYKLNKMTLPQNVVSYLNNTNNDSEFVKFSNKEEIAFFYENDWIVDYKSFYQLSLEELENNIKDLDNELAKLHAFIDRYETNYQLIENKKIKAEQLRRKKQSLEKIILLKKGQNSVDLPVVKDSDGTSLVSQDGIYEMCNSLNRNTLLLSRCDGNELRENESIPLSFIQGAISIILFELIDDNHYSGDYKIILSDDRKNLIIELKAYDKVDEKDAENKKELDQDIRKKKEPYLKKVFKSILTKFNNG